MDLELHQLDLRYEALRSREPRRERQLLASLAESGQQQPVVVVKAGEGGGWIVIDGYKRIRALRRLAHDTVRATCWELGEAEALVLERLMRAGAADGALAQGWLLAELSQRFGLSQPELARRLDKSQSWVSRRLSLVQELPAPIQARVRAGELCGHAAMKCLVPMARANEAAAERLAASIAPLKLATRPVAQLWAGWQGGNEKTRELIETQPALYLRSHEQAAREAAHKSPVEQLVSDVDALGASARRARKKLSPGLWRGLTASEREDAGRCVDQARADCAALWTRFDKEVRDARPGDAHGDPGAA